MSSECSACQLAWPCVQDACPPWCRHCPHGYKEMSSWSEQAWQSPWAITISFLSCADNILVQIGLCHALPVTHFRCQCTRFPCSPSWVWQSSVFCVGVVCVGVVGVPTDFKTTITPERPFVRGLLSNVVVFLWGDLLMPPLISARNDVVGIEVVADPKGVVLCLVGSGEEKISWISVHSCFLCSRCSLCFIMGKRQMATRAMPILHLCRIHVPRKMTISALNETCCSPCCIHDPPQDDFAPWAINIL